MEIATLAVQVLMLIGVCTLTVAGIVMSVRHMRPAAARHVEEAHELSSAAPAAPAVSFWNGQAPAVTTHSERLRAAALVALEAGDLRRYNECCGQLAEEERRKDNAPQAQVIPFPRQRVGS